MVHEVSTSMYEIQTKTCNGRKGKITEDTITLFDNAICRDNKIIVPIQEKIGLIVCDTGGNPYGIEIVTTMPTTTKEINNKDKTNTIQVSGSITKTESLQGLGDFLIGEAPQGSGVTSTVYLKVWYECDLGNKRTKEAIEKAIKDCVAIYKTNVQWKLITFQKDQTQDKIYYTQNGELGDACESVDQIRRFDDNSKDKYDRNSCETSSSTSGSSQNYCKEHEDEIKQQLEQQGKKVKGVFDNIDEALKVCRNPQSINILDAKVTCQICFK